MSWMSPQNTACQVLHIGHYRESCLYSVMIYYIVHSCDDCWLIQRLKSAGTQGTGAGCGFDDPRSWLWFWWSLSYIWIRFPTNTCKQDLIGDQCANIQTHENPRYSLYYNIRINSYWVLLFSLFWFQYLLVCAGFNIMTNVFSLADWGPCRLPMIKGKC